jgi:hypothetical protein
MASEFEQTKREVSGRSVMITSWFDTTKNGWHASAPSYNNVGSLSPMAGREMCRTRQAAIDQVVHILVRHFGDKSRIDGDPIIFL